LFQLTVDVHALTPSWWIERRQRCTTGNGYCGRHTLNCRVCSVYELALEFSRGFDNTILKFQSQSCVSTDRK